MGLIISKAYLVSNLLSKDIKRIDTRNGYGRGLVKAGEKNKNVVVLCADLTESTRSLWFKEKFPERFWYMGISEADTVCTAAGLARLWKAEPCPSLRGRRATSFS